MLCGLGCCFVSGILCGAFGDGSVVLCLDVLYLVVWFCVLVCLMLLFE